MSGIHRRLRIGKYTIPVLLLAVLLIGSASALVYVVVTWQLSLTVVANPRVHFWDGSTAYNTMDIDMNIFPDIKTIDTDATYDIRSTSAGDVYIRITTIPTEVTKINITAYTTIGNNLFSKEWTAGQDTWYGPYTTSATNPTIYNLWIEVTGYSDASPGSVSVNVELRVENP